jgi:hypothetical protein
MGTIEVPEFGWLELPILGCSSFEGWVCHYMQKV